LYYNYFRDYEPGAGRYIESDPIGLSGGVNTFAYAFSASIRFSDPDGLLSGSWVRPSPGPGIPIPVPLPSGGSGSKGNPGNSGLNPSYHEWSITPPRSQSATDTKANCKDDEPDCKYASPFHRKAARGPFAPNGINDEHAYKDDYGATPNKLYDICACKDGSIVIKHVGQCGEPGPSIPTHERWK
jgi:uncharacterized protein RhaS with RHS repeats